MIRVYIWICVWHLRHERKPNHRPFCVQLDLFRRLRRRIYELFRVNDGDDGDAGDDDNGDDGDDHGENGDNDDG